MTDPLECLILEADQAKRWTRAALRWTPSKQLVFALPPDTNPGAACDRIESAMLRTFTFEGARSATGLLKAVTMLRGAAPS